MSVNGWANTDVEVRRVIAATASSAVLRMNFVRCEMALMGSIYIQRYCMTTAGLDVR